ncbi:MAG: hypothetical protein JXA69_01115 [Phycisphaerae bacterium]|nr:hypothetical protein [Phycisphaerae bacterium]
MANGKITIRVECAIGGRRSPAETTRSFRGDVLVGSVRQPDIRSERVDTGTLKRGQCSSGTIAEAME